MGTMRATERRGKRTGVFKVLEINEVAQSALRIQNSSLYFKNRRILE